MVKTFHYYDIEHFPPGGMMKEDWIEVFKHRDDTLLEIDKLKQQGWEVTRTENDVAENQLPYITVELMHG